MSAPSSSGQTCPDCAALNPPWATECLRCHGVLGAPPRYGLPIAEAAVSTGGIPFEPDRARAPPASSGTGGPPETTSGPARRERTLVVGTAIAVAAIVVVLLLLLAGAVPGINLGLSPGGGVGPGNEVPLTFDQAAAQANGSAATVGPGPWYVTDANGFDVLNVVPGTTFSAFQNYSYYGCSTVAGPTAPPNIPAHSGNYTQGTLIAWYFILYEPSQYVALYLLVLSSTTNILGTVTGSSCTVAESIRAAPGWTLNSPAIAQAAGAVYDIASAYPQGDAELTYTPGDSLYGVSSQWLVTYIGCDSTNQTSQVFLAYVDGTTGAVTSSQSSGSSSGCSTTNPFGP